MRGPMTDDADREGNRLAPWLAPVAETGFGVLAITVGLAFPPAAFAALASPVVGKAAGRWLVSRISDGEEVLQEEHVSPEDVAAAIEDNEAVADLLRTTVNGVLASRDRGQRRLLSRALAHGVKDDAQVEPELRLASVVTQLDVPDVQALLVLCRHRPERIGPTPKPDEGKPPDKRQANTLWPDELAREWPEGAGVAHQVMAKLVGLGLAYDRAGIVWGGVLHWEATEFGRRVIERLLEEAEPAD